MPDQSQASDRSARFVTPITSWALLATLLFPLERPAFADEPPKLATPPAVSAQPAATPFAAPSATSQAPLAAGTAVPVEDAPPSEAQKTEAKGHFEKGLKLFQDQAWGPALAEFLRSREIFPTRAATRNAAVALRKLQRYDESLVMFETLLRDFPSMPLGERESAQKNATELRDLVGTIEISGAESGAAIAISGTNRGEFPPVVPLRVSAGSHVVRLVKEGFEPFETRVEVAGGQLVPVVAKMKKLVDSGRLRVTERGGRTLDVWIDGGRVGETPWEGIQGVGNHTVVLRSPGKLGTQPVSVVVKSQQPANLSLTAEDLESSLRVEPTPGGAVVAIDSVTVGSGVWLGRLKVGLHKIEVTSDGFRPVLKEVTLEKGGRETVKVALERDPNAAFWRKPPRVAMELSAAIPFLPSFGGDVAGKCTGTCSQSIGIGALGFGHGTYELGSGFGFGLSLGYLFGFQTVSKRPTQLLPYSHDNAPPPQDGTADDVLRLSSFMAGVHLSYHFGESIPVLLRASGGVMIGQIRDERSGTFTSTTGESGPRQYQSPAVLDRQMAMYGYVDLEPKVGLKLSKDTDLSLGVQVLLLIGTSPPKWTQATQGAQAIQPTEASAGLDGRGTYAGEPVLGSILFGVAPTASLRYYF